MSKIQISETKANYKTNYNIFKKNKRIPDAKDNRQRPSLHISKHYTGTVTQLVVTSVLIDNSHSEIKVNTLIHKKYVVTIDNNTSTSGATDSMAFKV